MTTFALIHGGGHGGWCWEDVVPRLRALGHSAVTPDLPMDRSEAGVSDWADVVIGALDDHADDHADADANMDVIAVAHSMGGMVLPVLAARRPIRRMVFLAAMVPVPGQVYANYLATEPGAVTMPLDRATSDEQGRSVVGWELAREAFFPDCTEQVARRAFERLVPTAPTAFGEMCPIDTWPDVASSYILGTKDRCVGPDWSRRVATQRLGTEPIELVGSSHSPFYSRPDELVAVLHRIATTD